MTDNEIRAAAVGIITYQAILSSGKAPEVIDNSTHVIVDSKSYEALKEAIRFCGRSNIDKAQISFSDCKGGFAS